MITAIMVDIYWGVGIVGILVLEELNVIQETGVAMVETDIPEHQLLAMVGALA